MQMISLRIPDELLKEAEKLSNKLELSRTEYIKNAIIVMNEKCIKELKANRLKLASKRVRAESMKINHEFSEVECDPEQ